MENYSLINLFIDECKSLNKIDRLNLILEKLKDLRCNDYNIELLDSIINMEYNLEYEDTPPYCKYFNNIRQTYDKQLSMLLKNKNKPRKRIEYWNDVISNFKIDIRHELAVIK